MTINITRDDYNAVTTVLTHFDFAKVHKTMTFLDWRWGLSPSNKVPTMAELRRSASDRLFDAVEGARVHYSQWISYSGGLKATAEILENGSIWVSLEFILTDWEHGDYDSQ
jgi:hypothetical protein